MSDALILALGIVFVIEGLAIALAPSVIEDLIEMLRAIKPNTLRLIGIVCMGLGAGLILQIAG